VRNPLSGLEKLWNLDEGMKQLGEKKEEGRENGNPLQLLNATGFHFM